MALVSILTGALAPTLSHALANDKYQSAPWQQICTSVDNPFNDNPADTPDNKPMPVNMQHCAYCTAHAPVIAVADVQPVVLLSPTPGRDFPPLFYQAHHPLFTWASANPRAPPGHLI